MKLIFTTSPSPSGILYALLTHKGKQARRSLGVILKDAEWCRVNNKVYGPGANNYAHINEAYQTLSRVLDAALSEGQDPMEVFRSTMRNGMFLPAGHSSGSSVIEKYDAWTLRMESAGFDSLVRTIRSARAYIEIAYEGAKMEGLSVIDLYRVLSGSVSSRTMEIYIQIFRRFYRETTNRDLQGKIKIAKRVPTLKIALTKSELKSFENAVLHDRLQDLARSAFILSAHTGLRVSDLYQIVEWSSVAREVDGKSVEVAELVMKKTGDVIVVPLSAGARRALSGLPSPLQPELSEALYRKNLRLAAAEAGLNRVVIRHRQHGTKLVQERIPLHKALRPHDARRTFATHMADALPIDAVQKLLGHKSIVQTQQYIARSYDDVLSMATDALASQ